MSEDSCKRAEEVRGDLRKPKDISVARQIVAMLLKENRNNYRLLMKAIKERDESSFASALYERLDYRVAIASSTYAESHKLAEMSRRILYKTNED